MPAIIPNNNIEKLLRDLLKKEGYLLSPFKLNGETGVDILALKKGELPINIEVIGYKSSPPARAKDFYEVFFRAISRLKGEPVRIVIAVASIAERGLPARANQHRIGWQRIGKSFPELELWLIDTDKYTYKRTKWNDWLRDDMSC